MLKPFLTEPFLVPKVWGGRALETEYGKSLPSNEPFGESWEVADLPQGSCTIATGPHAGKSLTELVDEFGELLCGEGFERFPLLVKILDAKENLSVQVHPGAADLVRHPGARLKDETWLFLGGEGVVYHGLREGVSISDMQDALASRTGVVELLRTFQGRPGDAIRVSPGTVHAIGADVSLLEIQTPSDTTYRVWDYERRGMDGELRQLHVAQALDVMRESNDETLRTNSGDAVVETPHYEIHRFEGEGTWEAGVSRVVVNVGSEGLLVGELEVPAFQTAVIPACFGPTTYRGSGVICWAV